MATVASTSTAVGERRRNRPDSVLLVSVIVLSAFGLLMIYSATRVAREILGQLPSVDMERQMIFFVAGTIGMFVFTFLDYREFRNFLPLIYVATIVALLAVYLFEPVKGAQRWIPLGPFGLQPAEFAKIVTIIGVAALLAQNQSDKLQWRTIVMAGVLMAVPGYLILRQPDLGTSMSFPFILLGMLFAAGMTWKQLGWIVGPAVAAVVAAFRLEVFAAHQMNRINVFLEGPEVDPEGIGFQLIQSKLAIGSGQVFGKGLFVGTQTAVPEQDTDFIFAVVGEQFGFVGGLLVLSVFLVVIWRLFVIAAHARDRFGAMLVVGIASMLAFHVFVNIGMTIGIAPVTGVPLPFISQGGSFFLAMSIAIGIANSVWLRRSPVPGETYIV